MNSRRSALAVTALLAVMPARAQSTVATEKQLPLALALEAAQGTLDQCRKDGFRVSVTVLNNAGQPIVLLRGGGVPIKSGNDTIGAIGVSGTPTGEKDEACGQAGIDRIAERLK